MYCNQIKLFIDILLYNFNLRNIFNTKNHWPQWVSSKQIEAKKEILKKIFNLERSLSPQKSKKPMLKPAVDEGKEGKEEPAATQRKNNFKNSKIAKKRYNKEWPLTISVLGVNCLTVGKRRGYGHPSAPILWTNLYGSSDSHIITWLGKPFWLVHKFTGLTVHFSSLFSFQIFWSRTEKGEKLEDMMVRKNCPLVLIDLDFYF